MLEQLTSIKQSVLIKHMYLVLFVKWMLIEYCSLLEIVNIQFKGFAEIYQANRIDVI